MEQHEVSFLELLESEEAELELTEEENMALDQECLLALDDEEKEELREELGITMEEFEDLLETTVRSVSSTGSITRKKSRAVRQRRATTTTGMSRSALRQRARRAARTRKRNPGALRKAVRKRNKAMRKRRQLKIK